MPHLGQLTPVLHGSARASRFPTLPQRRVQITEPLQLLGVETAAPREHARFCGEVCILIVIKRKRRDSQRGVGGGGHQTDTGDILLCTTFLSFFRESGRSAESTGRALRLGTSETVTLGCSERGKEIRVIGTHPSSQRGQTKTSNCSLLFQFKFYFSVCLSAYLFWERSRLRKTAVCTQVWFYLWEFSQN